MSLFPVELGIFYRPASTIALLFLFLLLFILIKLSKRGKRNYNLPSSPPRLPIIGNLHQLGSSPHRSLRSLAQQHGSLMLLHLGLQPTLVVSSADAAEDIMKSHDLIFSDRPNSRISERLFYNKKDLAFAPLGDYWRQIRRICVLQLLSAKQVQSFRRVREEETTVLMEKIQRRCSASPSSSGLVDLSELLISVTNNIICRVAFGRKYSGGDGAKWKKILDEFVALLGVFDVGDFIPWLGWVSYVNGLNTRLEKVFREVDSFLDGVVEAHLHRNKGDKGENKDKEDLVDVLLSIQTDSTTDAPLAKENIKAIILDLFAAGTDTTHTLMEWAMVELVRHPQVMMEVQAEVKQIAGGGSEVTEDKVDQMRLLKAVIKETLRLHPPVPLLLPRESTQDANIGGYDIPAKTRVIINYWAIGRDPMLWEEPDEFRPQRFLNSPIDFKGHDFQLIPFGAGRRGCPGITFATAVNELVLANLVYKFNWAVPGGASPNDLDMTEASALTVRRKSHLLLVATPNCF